MVTVRDIPPLLHDARLSACRWDRDLHTLTLSFLCLRRNVDGTPIEPSAVDLKLSGVERIAAYYSPAGVLVKPSEFELDMRIRLADIEDWPYEPTEAHLAINSPQAEFEEATACVREGLFGDRGESDESPLRIHLAFEPHNHGRCGVASALAINCDEVEPFTNGVPLDIGTWGRQFEAWWTGWREHWSEKDRSNSDEWAWEDTFIPAAKSDPPGVSYHPPATVPVLLTASTVPAELLRPIEDYHAGICERDWRRVATAYPYFDLGLEERAGQLQERFLNDDYGRWVYIRHIDEWWCEGNRACVVVRGIEHVMGDDESPAENRETVITYGLRMYRGSWVIVTWSQAHPRFGSADRLLTAQSWRDGWNLAE